MPLTLHSCAPGTEGSTHRLHQAADSNPMMAATHPCGTRTEAHATTHSALHACCSSSTADALFMDEIMLCMAPGHITAHHALLLQAHGAALSHYICSMSFLGSYVTQSSLTCHQHTFSSHSCAWTSSHIAGMLQTAIESSNTVHGINTFA